jgi:adenylate cyclase
MDRQEHKVERRLAAIFATDVVGYSRLMEADEVGTLQTLTAHREVIDRQIAEHGGSIANTAGDRAFAEFPDGQSDAPGNEYEASCPVAIV